jgi:phosphohistidine phosphatase SixA
MKDTQTPPVNLRFLLLMRHAKHSRGRVKDKPKGPTPLDDIASSLGDLAQIWTAMRGTGISTAPEFAHDTQNTVLTDQGRYETLVAAKRLKDFLPEWTEKLMLGAVVHYDNSEASETRETATIFCKGFDPSVKPTPWKLLGPKTKPIALKKRKRGSPLEKVVKRKAGKLIPSATANAVLFIGHQPAIGWLASALLDRAVPIAQSEILCIDVATKPPALMWCISPAGNVLEELQNKIKSKMALANLLSAFITAGLGVLLTMLADDKKMGALGQQAPVVFGAAAALLLAVALYLRTMFSYDTLLMPVRFWAESSSGTSHRPAWIVARPPSGAHWILYQNMMRIWQWQFIPATFLTLSGLFMLWGSVTFGALPIAHCVNPLISRVIIVSVPVVTLLWILCAKAMDIARGVRGGWHNFFSCRGLAPKFRYLCGPWLGSED